MYVGIPNANIAMPLEKMKITNLETGKTTTVLYNPQSYTQMKYVEYAQSPQFGGDAPVVQFLSGGAEILSFELFFDSLSAGAEVGGGAADKLKFAGNSLLPSAANAIDVRDYTKKIFKLTGIESSVHRPPELKVEWASLQFKGFLAACTQRFLKFDEKGQPVRAILECQFIEHRDEKHIFTSNPLESPDTTKYRTVRQGDSLWAFAAREYGEASEWRRIAVANGLSNPRKLRSGDTLVLPAIP
ncbi:MAG: LysM peptidoglycan-binding domain-containing protein [Oscillospiraceae bacterium]|nr:LysM peptidoglycan-binding domain-containing protein [Oscillospiraceae bacterium]